MARRATATERTLGADKLAKLILDEVRHNAAFKRIVTAALAGARDTDAGAAIIDRRLASLERARRAVNRDKRRAFAADLEATVSTIVDDTWRRRSSGVASGRTDAFARPGPKSRMKSGAILQVSSWDYKSAIPIVDL